MQPLCVWVNIMVPKDTFCLCIVEELAGRGSVALTVGIGERRQVTSARCHALCSKVKFNLKGLSPPIFLQILSFVTKTSCFCKFEKYPTRESGVSSTQYALLLL